MNGKNIDSNKKEKNFRSQHKVDWKDALVNMIGKGPLTGPNKNLLNTLLSIEGEWVKHCFSFIVM